jgi:hypothetical protein
MMAELFLQDSGVIALAFPQMNNVTNANKLNFFINFKFKR